MTIRIRIEHGQDAGKTWRLSQPGVYVLGRHVASSMRVLDMKVSKAHAEVHLVENNGATNAVFRDLGSTHGSQLNGQPVKQRDKPLRPGDELRLGLTILRVLSDGAGDDAAPATDRKLDQSSVSTATSSSGMIDTSSAPKLPPDQLVGKNLGGYKVQQKIGQGGMGAVYLAEQVSLHRQVALKVLSDKFVKDEAFVDQFLNEARAAGQLNHPNVVQVYDVGEAQDHYYFSMEFVSGGSIEERMRGGEDYTWQDGLNWFLDATNALVFAKKRDILHRDVKPDNLMVSEDGSAKLCDLGLAKRSENADLMDQGIIGTPHFISPEAIRRKTSVDHRTDLYSLGCTFFRTFTGKNPYPGSTVKEILLGHLNKPVPHITSINKEIPKELDEIVFKLMQKDPEERFQTPDELLVALDKVRVRHGLEAHGIAPKGGKRWIALAVLALVVAAGAAIFALNQEPEVEVQEISEEEKARIRDAAITEASQTYAQPPRDAQDEKLKLDGKLVELKGEHGSAVWKNAEYKALPEEYDEFVTKWETQVATWKGERDKQEFDEVKQTIDEAVSTVESEISGAKGKAQEIRAHIKKREESAQLWDETRTTALADITSLLDKKKVELQALFDAGPGDFTKWVELAIALGGDLDQAKAMLKELIQTKYDEAVVAGEPVLEYEKEVEPLITKRFPDSLLKRWLDNPRTQILSKNADAVMRADKLVRANGSTTVESLKAGIDFLVGWMAKLPENVDPAAGKIAADIASARKTAKERHDALVKQRQEKIFLGLLTDRIRYHAMIREIRAPRGYGKGHWYTFKHSQAKLTIQTWVARFTTDEYKALGQIWLRDSAAFTALFENLKKSWDADKWGGERNVIYIDDDGLERKCRCQEVELDRMEDKRDVILFEQLGPRRLLDSIFFAKDKNELKPRFEFDATDYRGLALLAEMASDFKRAAAWWKRVETLSEAGSDDAKDARHHISQLPKEEQAGGTWSHLQKMRADIENLIERFNPTRRELTPEDWGKFLDEVPELNTKLGEIQMGLDKLGADKGMATSVWASSLRPTPHRDAAYAGDEMPADVYDSLIDRAMNLARKR